MIEGDGDETLYCSAPIAERREPTCVDDLGYDQVDLVGRRLRGPLTIAAAGPLAPPFREQARDWDEFFAFGRSPRRG